jgi:hypothetical protein
MDAFRQVFENIKRGKSWKENEKESLWEEKTDWIVFVDRPT